MTSLGKTCAETLLGGSIRGLGGGFGLQIDDPSGEDLLLPQGGRQHRLHLRQDRSGARAPLVVVATLDPRNQSPIDSPTGTP